MNTNILCHHCRYGAAPGLFRGCNCPEHRTGRWTLADPTPERVQAFERATHSTLDAMENCTAARPYIAAVVASLMGECPQYAATGSETPQISRLAI